MGSGFHNTSLIALRILLAVALLPTRKCVSDIWKLEILGTSYISHTFPLHRFQHQLKVQ